MKLMRVVYALVLRVSMYTRDKLRGRKGRSLEYKNLVKIHRENGLVIAAIDGYFSVDDLRKVISEMDDNTIEQAQDATAAAGAAEAQKDEAQTVSFADEVKAELATVRAEIVALANGGDIALAFHRLFDWFESKAK